MRAGFLLCLLAWSEAVISQVFPEPQRLDILLIPVVVVGAADTRSFAVEDYEREKARVREAQLPSTLSTVRDALDMLGVMTGEYDLRPYDVTGLAICRKTRVLLATAGLECGSYIDGEGWIPGNEAILQQMALFGMVQDLDDGMPLDEAVDKGAGSAMNTPRGYVILWVPLTPTTNWWSDRVVGEAFALIAVDWTEQHWSTSACAAWAVNKVVNIAHEMGHCFGLIHNQDDTRDRDFDLMRDDGAQGNREYLKDNNKAIVRHHFRALSPDTSPR